MFGGGNYGGKPSGVSKAATALAKAVGLGAAIMSAPLVFIKTKAPLYAYFFSYLNDADFALILAWLMNAIFFFVIFALVSMILSFILIWAVARFAAKTLG